MGYEIDFLAVGDESQSGDAIALRYGNLRGPRSEQVIAVIDGGFADNGVALTNLVRERYDAHYVDVVISTHPDQDHISGLKAVIEELGMPGITQLWMHQPWKHSAELNSARYYRFGTTQLSETVRMSLEQASDLERLAEQNGIDIVEPFTGVSTPDRGLVVLGPTQSFYEETLANVRPPSLASRLAEALKSAVAKLVPETLFHETLKDDGVTQPVNNTSVISLLWVDGPRCLFTGDAGIPALEQAADVLDQVSIAAGGIHIVQVPHHGSRRNVGPSVLNRLLGSIGQTEPRGSAIASVATQGEPKHPAKKVANAFRRRGYPVRVTQGRNSWFYADAPPRDDYGPTDPLPFYDQVEDEEG